MCVPPVLRSSEPGKAKTRSIGSGRSDIKTESSLRPPEPSSITGAEAQERFPPEKHSDTPQRPRSHLLQGCLLRASAQLNGKDPAITRSSDTWRKKRRPKNPSSVPFQPQRQLATATNLCTETFPHSDAQHPSSRSEPRFLESSTRR